MENYHHHLHHFLNESHNIDSVELVFDDHYSFVVQWAFPTEQQIDLEKIIFINIIILYSLEDYQQILLPIKKCRRRCYVHHYLMLDKYALLYPSLNNLFLIVAQTKNNFFFLFRIFELYFSYSNISNPSIEFIFCINTHIFNIFRAFLLNQWMLKRRRKKKLERFI